MDIGGTVLRFLGPDGEAMPLQAPMAHRFAIMLGSCYFEASPLPYSLTVLFCKSWS